MIDIEMDMRQYDCPFIDTTDDNEVTFAATHWEFNPVEEELDTRMVVESADSTALDQGLRALRDHDQMRTFDLVAKRDDAARIRTTIEQTDAMETIRRHDGYITGPFHIEDGSETWHVGFDDPGRADSTLSELERNNEFAVLARESHEIPEIGTLVQNAGAAMTLIEGCQALSEIERETLQAAATGGYYDNPREMDLAALAEAFDVSKPAASKNLRRAERKLVRHVVAALGDLAE
ncbi:MAG: helix-turn-helix domain-containing protein [Halobacteriaceae archaeon]